MWQPRDDIKYFRFMIRHNFNMSVRVRGGLHHRSWVHAAEEPNTPKAAIIYERQYRADLRALRGIVSGLTSNRS